ncbi:TnsA endonuclease C terminal [Paenibacillus sophorae]|uniref:Heteromeric transposase endonuclease subunit TnsA n=1 Tax=Paenibacillus sophorae TaxID=1333845 RepID=A0A1H8VWP8_9BACL|nr:heteromeric transposase endonuclease subunit TnsA [Paenibacillus sophorae]QWU15619.1 heteromeric transposase endonuclease subunit TnsA [Paenibacillus sophorae]SEP19816.1 TnsA endonuclease C terminal [Paenibacillus sophorae]
MGKRRTVTTALSIARRIREGRGEGHFAAYKPWLTIHDVPSTGVVTRILGWKSGRLHHYLSEHLELAHHYQLEWAENVLDIREQFPLLPLERTLFIAQKLGIKHPVDPKTKYPIVMTTDMLLTIKKGDDIRFVAHSIKPLNKLKKRVVEKLQIEKQFFKEQRTDWSLITEKQINYDLVRNVEWLHSARSFAGHMHITSDLVKHLEPPLLKAISQSDLPLTDVTMEQDLKHGLPKGTCIQIVRHLIANRYWIVDMTERILPTMEPLKIIGLLYHKGGMK